jgi:hypothetical protein
MTSQLRQLEDPDLGFICIHEHKNSGRVYRYRPSKLLQVFRLSLCFDSVTKPFRFGCGIKAQFAICAVLSRHPTCHQNDNNALISSLAPVGRPSPHRSSTSNRGLCLFAYASILSAHTSIISVIIRHTGAIKEFTMNSAASTACTCSSSRP